MTTKWYYARAGETQGPFSATELKERAAAGLLQPHDPLWPEGADPQGAVEACSALDWSALSCSAPVLPDWLEDVRQAARPDAQPLPPPTHALPDWLGDVRQTEEATGRGLPEEGRVRPAAALDWLEDVRRSEPPDRVRSASSTPEATGAPAPPAATSAEIEAAAGRILLGVAVPATEVGPGSIPLAMPVEPGETGFHPQPGPRQPEPPSQPAEPFDVIFRRARVEIQRWVDLEENRSLVLRADMEAIRRDASLQEVLRRYQYHGHELTQKLWQYLEFLVENRRKYYAACQGQGR